MNKDLKDAVDAAIEDLESFIRQSSGEEVFYGSMRQDAALRRTFEYIKDTIEELVELAESKPFDTVP